MCGETSLQPVSASLMRESGRSWSFPVFPLPQAGPALSQSLMLLRDWFLDFGPGGLSGHDTGRQAS